MDNANHVLRLFDDDLPSEYVGDIDGITIFISGLQYVTL